MGFFFFLPLCYLTVQEALVFNIFLFLASGSQHLSCTPAQSLANRRGSNRGRKLHRTGISQAPPPKKPKPTSKLPLSTAVQRVTLHQIKIFVFSFAGNFKEQNMQNVGSVPPCCLATVREAGLLTVVGGGLKSMPAGSGCAALTLSTCFL